MNEAVASDSESEGAQYLQSCLAICASRTLADTRTEERRDREREKGGLSRR